MSVKIKRIFMYINKGSRIKGPAADILSAKYKRRSVGSVIGLVKKAGQQDHLLTSLQASRAAVRLATGQKSLGLSSRKERLLMKELGQEGALKIRLNTSPIRASTTYHRLANETVEQTPASVLVSADNEEETGGASSHLASRGQKYLAKLHDKIRQRHDENEEKRKVHVVGRNNTKNFGRAVVKSSSVSIDQMTRERTNKKISKITDADSGELPNGVTDLPPVQLD